MQQISIYTAAEQNKAITLKVAKVTSSISTAGIKDHIEYQDEDGGKG